MSTDMQVGTGRFLRKLSEFSIPASEPIRRDLTALYRAEIAYTDARLGDFLERLDSLGHLNDTWIVVVADHGEEFFDHGWWEHGKTLYAEQIHVPLMMRLPGGRLGWAEDPGCSPADRSHADAPRWSRSSRRRSGRSTGEACCLCWPRSHSSVQVPSFASLDIDERRVESVIDRELKLIETFEYTHPRGPSSGCSAVRLVGGPGRTGSTWHHDGPLQCAYLLSKLRAERSRAKTGTSNRVPQPWILRCKRSFGPLAISAEMGRSVACALRSRFPNRRGQESGEDGETAELGMDLHRSTRAHPVQRLEALVVDDAAYVKFAEQITSSPGDPYGFQILWRDRPEPANRLLAPPVVPYWIAAAKALFGGHPLAWKLWLFPFSFLLTAAAFRLSARLAPGRELLVVWMLVLAPGVLSGFNLMTDVPALALALLSLAVGVEAVHRERIDWAMAAGLVAALAMQTKYSSAGALAATALYALLHRRVLIAACVVVVAGLVFCGWEYFILLRYGESHLGQALAGPVTGGERTLSAQRYWACSASSVRPARESLCSAWSGFGFALVCSWGRLSSR